MAKQKVLFKFGTAAQYAELESKQDNALYFLLDTNELYRGSIPFGQPHVYTGTRNTGATDAETINALIGENTVVHGDLVVIKNSDDSSDAFLYSKDEDEWLHIGSTVTDSLVTRVTALESAVVDLETALQGENDQGGLIDKVADLETALANISGAFHFRGSVENLDLVENPAEGDVYQVGDAEFAWNGNAWIELGSTFDLSNYVTNDTLNTTVTQINNQIADLEALLGAPASTEEDPVTGELVTVPATGIYADLAEHADQIIPLFNGVIAGLVPPDVADLSAQVKATHFLNALGNWVTVSSTGGQTTYTDPEGHVYTTVEEYVTYMIQNHIEALEYVWESIDDQE